MYIDNPVNEINGHFNKFSFLYENNSRGFHVGLTFPKPWKNKEGESPNVIRAWTNQNGNGINEASFGLADLEGQPYSKEEIKSLVNYMLAIQSGIGTGAIIKEVDDKSTLIIKYEKFWKTLRSNKLLEIRNFIY